MRNPFLHPVTLPRSGSGPNGETVTKLAKMAVFVAIILAGAYFAFVLLFANR
jgi:hypothetical protein